MDRNPSSREFVMRNMAENGVPLNSLLELAISHSISAVLFSAFQRHGIIPLLPDTLAGIMCQLYRINVTKNREIMDQVAEINRAFSVNGIRHLYLKGVSYLLREMYTDPAERMMTDIDIMVSPEDLSASAKILEKIGYGYVLSVSEGENLRHRHLPPFVHPGKAVPVEIHRYPLPGRYSELLPSDQAFAGSQIIEDSRARVLSVDHQQMLQFFHERHHARGKLSSLGSLRGLYDFYLLSRIREPVITDIPGKRTGKKYLRYFHAVEALFNDHEDTDPQKWRKMSWYLKKELFLIDHPEFDRLYNKLIYTPFYILGLAFKSIYSEYARRLLVKKLQRNFPKIFR